MAKPTIQPGQIKTGPGRILYRYGLTAMPTEPPATTPELNAAGSKVTYAWTSWIEVGATDTGLTYNETVDTEAVRVAESQYDVRVVETGRSGSVNFAMTHISDVNWKLANNGGTITINGTGDTKLSAYTPPLVGQSVRVALGFHSLEEQELIIWPQVFNTGGFETARAGFAEKALLPVSFAVELPDASVLAYPYKRWTAGSLAQGT
jgi:hypothetical protein